MLQENLITHRTVPYVPGHTEGYPLGHTWSDATIYAPKTCSVCGETEGAPIGGWEKVIVTKGENEGEFDILSLLDRNVVVLEAEYNNDEKMLQVNYKTVDLVAHENYKYEVDFNKYSNGNNVKVFIWDDIDNITPLCDFIKFEVK